MAPPTLLASPPAVEPAAAARAAGLRYVTDAAPGFRRRRAGRGFAYLDREGRVIRDPAVLARIRSLAIPPAWRDVWICPIAEGHIQAVGRDARGRKQYRYHARWREVRDETKYDRLAAFARALPAIRARVERDLARTALERETVLALVVRLLEATAIRVGNDEYARANHSFGLTTLRDRHADVDGGVLRFEFRGKGGKAHRIEVHDRRLARLVKRCQELPGQELFQYVDASGQRVTIDSADVNAYLRAAANDDFTAKDFRTWIGTVEAARALLEAGACASRAEAKRRVSAAIASVAARLGNTPAVCRKAYVHPAVLDAYEAGRLERALARRRNGAGARLTGDEAAVAWLLSTSAKEAKRAFAGALEASLTEARTTRRERVRETRRSYARPAPASRSRRARERRPA